MFNKYDSNPKLTNVTFSENSANGSGGGFYNSENSTPTLTNAILWGNTPDQIDGDAPIVISYSDIQGGYGGDHNIDEDPLLGALADNGGSTLTHALRYGSPAIDTGCLESCPAADQRGWLSPVDVDGDGEAICDMGAFEFYPQYYLPLVQKN